MVIWFVTHDYSWFFRGTNFSHGTDASLFAFGNTYGHAGTTVSFRWYFTMI